MKRLGFITIWTIKMGTRAFLPEQTIIIKINQQQREFEHQNTKVYKVNEHPYSYTPCYSLLQISAPRREKSLFWQVGAHCFPQPFPDSLSRLWYFPLLTWKAQTQSTPRDEENKGTLFTESRSHLKNSHGYYGLNFHGETRNIVWAGFAFLVCALKKLLLFATVIRTRTFLM